MRDIFNYITPKELEWYYKYQNINSQINYINGLLFNGIFVTSFISWIQQRYYIEFNIFKILGKMAP